MDSKQFSPHLFWDVDIADIDIEKNKIWLIGRVLDYGVWSDWKLISNHFTKQEIKDAALNIRCMSAKSLNFISLYTQTPINEFRCYTERQLNPSPWNS